MALVEHNNVIVTPSGSLMPQRVVWQFYSMSEPESAPEGCESRIADLLHMSQCCITRLHMSQCYTSATWASVTALGFSCNSCPVLQNS